jgi:hypothetical protein
MPSPIKVKHPLWLQFHMEVLYIMPENERSAIAKCTLYRNLGVIADKYPLADVIENLAIIADERNYPKTTELLDNAVDTALSEVST